MGFGSQNFFAEAGVAKETEGFGDGVVAAFHEGVAAADAPEAKPGAPDDAEAINGCYGVLGASGAEAAGGRKHRGDESPVAFD